MQHTSRIAAALLTSTMLVSPAFAQDNADGETNYADDVIIVTATRRAQDIQDVPIAVTAITPEKLEKQGVVNIQDLSIVAPSFSTSQAQTSSGTVVLRVRGVGTTSNNIGFESAVGVFIDGAYQSRPGIALGEFVDVERVEVLRGPQGTLFGRNTSAGALNITNVAPDLYETGGFVNATYGNYNHTSVQGAVNVPLVEGKVGARLTGAYRNRDGYIDVYDAPGNKIGENNNVDQFMLRGQIGFEANNGLSGRLIADYSESDASCCGAVEVLQSVIEANNGFLATGIPGRGGMTEPIPATNTSQVGAAQAAVDNLNASANFIPNSGSDQIGFTAQLEYPVSDDLDLIYIGSYREYDSLENYDSDFSTLDAFSLTPSDTEIDTMTHELRLQGEAMGGRFNYMVGGYYADEKIEQEQNFELGADYDNLANGVILIASGGAAGANFFTFATGGVDISQTTSQNLFNQDSESWSVFTHNTLDVTDKFNVTVGLRYSDESKSGGYTQNAAGTNNQACPNALTNIGLGNIPAPLVGATFVFSCLPFTAPANLQASANPVVAGTAAAVGTPVTYDVDFADEELIYTGKLGYQVSDGTSLYASFTHGYKSGGINLDSAAGAAGNDPRFASEEVDAYEIGLKSRFADNRVTLNVAAFLEEFDNFQVLEFTGARFETFNVPKAETKGVEIETNARLSDSFTLNGAVTYLEAEYPEDCAPGSNDVRVLSLCGYTLTNAPKFVGVLGFNFENKLASTNLDYFISGQMRSESQRRTSTQGIIQPNAAAIAAAGSERAAVNAAPLNPFDVQQGTTKFNARVGISHDVQGWGLEVWGTNLTNEITRGVTFNTVLRSGSRSAFIQQPRMYGVTARKVF